MQAEVISDRFAFGENLVLNKMIASDRSADMIVTGVSRDA
jgi:hypothetical protein